MLPTTLLPNLSPIAAKLYLTLLSLQDKNAPTVRAPLKSLCTLTNLSDKSCRRALNQLRSLNLLATLPRHYQKPSTYILLTPLPDRSPTTGPSLNKPVPQDRTSSPTPPHTPTAAHKIPDRSHLTHLLNLYRASQNDRPLTRPSPTNHPSGTATVTERPSTPPSTGTPLAQATPNPSPSQLPPTNPDLDALLDPTLLKLLMAALPTDQTTQLLATAQATLARLDLPLSQEAHP